MSLSLTTNTAALRALLNLDSIQKKLTDTQTRVSSGYAVAAAKDNPIAYADAQDFRLQSRGLDVVSASLDKSISEVDTAIAAGQQVADLLTQIKNKMVTAAESQVDVPTIAAAVDNLRNQLADIVNGASFNGMNMLKSGGDSSTALISADGSHSMTVPAQDMSLGGALITLTAADTFTDNATAAAIRDKVEQSLINVNGALAALGVGSTTLQAQKDAALKQNDAIKTQAGALTDADMAYESGLLQSLQVRQQMTTNSLSIANDIGANLLTLFGNN